MQRRLSTFAVVLLLSLAVAPLASAQATPPFVRTAIVNSGGTPVANGAALLATLASIVTAGPTDPWLIKVEPGIYDLNGASLVMKTFVDIEGSGRNATFITSTDPNGTVTVPPGVDAELRELTVQNDSTGDGVGIVNRSNELKLTKVNIEINVGGNGTGFLTASTNPRLSAVFPRVNAAKDAIGVRILGGSPVINEMFIFIANVSGSSNFGMLIDGTGSAIVEGVSAVITGGAGNFGVFTQNQATPRVTNGRFSTIGGKKCYTLIATSGSAPEFDEVTAISTNGSSSVALYNDGGGSIFVSDTTLRASSPLPNEGLAFQSAGGVGTVTRLNQSNLIGSTQAIRIVGGTAFVGASQVQGGVFGAPTCASAYNGNYIPLNAACL